MIGLGIDTGGTCTDAVIYDLAQNTVLASAKTPTTKEDLKTGIRNVLDRLPQDLLSSCRTLALSTTLATNACVEGKWGNGRLILISLDRNILRRGTGALLNARLIPVIYEFLGAVRHVLAEFHLDLPLLIMRSDGHLMSSDYTALHPVETLLCGPAASTMGALSMTGEKRAVVVDMGGTTTDISIIRNREPLRIEGGIQIAEWKTFVKGLYVDTFALGGDTEVLFDSSGTCP